GPVANADAHGGAALPDGASAPACAVLLNRGDGCLGFFGRPKRDENLIEDDVVEDVEASGAESVAEAAGPAANAFDHFGHTATAKRTERSVYGDSAGASGFFGNKFVRIAFRAGGDDVGCGEGHGGPMGGFVSTEDETAVVRNVEPLVRVAGDGVGALDAAHEM